MSSPLQTKRNNNETREKIVCVACFNSRVSERMVDLLKIDPKNWICFFDQSEWSKRCKPYLKNGFDMMSVSVCWDDFDVVFFLNFIYGFLMCFCCCWLSIGFIRKSKIEANLIFSPVRPLQVHLNFLSLSLLADFCTKFWTKVSRNCLNFTICS